MNIKKTKYMKFGTRQKLETVDAPNQQLHNVRIEHVDHYKYLGTFLDSKLTFVKQANETILVSKL